MRNNIESFCNKMELMLSKDIINDIIYMISYSKNKEIIKKQKDLKIQLNKDIKKLFNIYYYDSNFMLYKNEYGQFILKNHKENNKKYYIYSNVQNYNSTDLIELNNTSNIEENEIILFREPNFEEIYDENGFIIQRRLNLNIVYI